MLPLLLHITLPLEDPILKFLLIMAIVLAAPLVLNKLRIPYLLGLIIAGAVIGPHGLNLVLRDSSIILSGTAGLLYIMFQSGLEIDMADFRRNGWRSLVFGLYTFSVPMATGIVAGHWILGYSIAASVLLAALFASQTLVAYPIVSRLGITRDRAVTIAVGGTVITDMLALLVLTVVVGISTGQTADGFWVRLGVSVVCCIAAILFLFPLVGRWFFKACSDHVAQYVFVLVMVFLGAFLAEAAGLEAIIGAFLAGLAMNRLIPRTSPLMNRIDFVGNAIFIPFFLIGVGMLIDYRAFFRSWETVEVSAVMIVMVTASKYLAACLTQKTFRLSRDQRTLLFGLSSAHVAATLAAVMVGYNVILGYTPEGEPIRLLGESILNGTILMIFFTCTIATFATQRGAHNIALKETENRGEEPAEERILIPVANAETTEELVNLSLALKSKRNKTGLYALHALDNRSGDSGSLKRAQKLLGTAVRTAAAADNHLQASVRYDVNAVNAIGSVILEQEITDVVMGLHRERGLIDTFLGATTQGILARHDVTTLIYRAAQPLSTVKRFLVSLPAQAEKEAGFPLWTQKLWNAARNTGSRIVFYAAPTTEGYLREMLRRRPIDAEFIPFDEREGFVMPAASSVRGDDCLWVVLSRRDRISYRTAMSRVPFYLDNHFRANSFVLVYPVQAGDTEKHYLG